MEEFIYSGHFVSAFYSKFGLTEHVIVNDFSFYLLNRNSHMVHIIN